MTKPIIIDKISHSIDTNKHVLIHGPGGTGKSYLIKTLAYHLRHNKNRDVLLTASTGIAGVNIGGTTFHSAFCLGLAKGKIEDVVKQVLRNKRKNKIKKYDIVIVDEISMIPKHVLEIVDKSCREIRNEMSHMSFGGIQFVFIGDFLQLPPVNGDWVFNSSVWKELDMDYYTLSQPKRFTCDSFFNALMRFREGKYTQKDLLQIQKRKRAYNEYIEQLHQETDIQPTVLYSTRKSVAQENDEKNNALTHKAYIYNAMDSVILPPASKLNPKQLLEQQTNTLELIAPK